MKIIDNFLPQYQFKQLTNILLGKEFSWYWNDRIIFPGDDGYDPKDYQFTHIVYDKRHPIRDDCSSHYPLIRDTFFSYLGVYECYKIKANLTPRTLFNKGGGWHVDFKHTPEIKNTAVYYLNTCNGYTKFKKGGKVKSVENRIVIFDSSLKHAGYTCTDQKRRVVINFNWI
tara:strand:+ start:78 stop:590 length:513 start_codon:yes stop_codon:yes gene_type:complete